MLPVPRRRHHIPLDRGLHQNLHPPAVQAPLPSCENENRHLGRHRRNRYSLRRLHHHVRCQHRDMRNGRDRHQPILRLCAHGARDLAGCDERRYGLLLGDPADPSRFEVEIVQEEEDRAVFDLCEWAWVCTLPFFSPFSSSLAWLIWKLVQCLRRKYRPSDHQREERLRRLGRDVGIRGTGSILVSPLYTRAGK